MPLIFASIVEEDLSEEQYHNRIELDAGTLARTLLNDDSLS